MSYILDALKKSQADNQDEGMTVRIDPVGQNKGISPIWAWLSGGLLALNLVAVVWFFSQDGATPTKDIVAQTPVQTPSTVQEPSAVRENKDSEPLVQEVVTQEPEAINMVADAPRVKPVRRFNLEDLPSSERARFADLTYTSHIYTDDPEFCAVVIDSQRLRVGDTFQDLKIHAITEFGLVFESTRENEVWRIAVNPFQ